MSDGTFRSVRALKRELSDDKGGSLLHILAGLWPYIWPSDRRDLKVRVLIAMVPAAAGEARHHRGSLHLQMGGRCADRAGHRAGRRRQSWLVWALAAPILMTIAYGGSRVLMAVLTQMRDGVFAKVSMHAVRRLAYLVFEHMHQLSLRFHLERKTGGLTRVLERGRTAIETIVRMVIMQAVPTVIELALIIGVLLYQFDWRYVAVIILTVIAYTVFTYVATEWRIGIRRRMNDSDTDANVKAVELAAQLRDGEIFQRRGARGAALRPLDGALRGGERPGLCLARRAQCRAGDDLHHRARGLHGDVRLRHPARPATPSAIS